MRAHIVIVAGVLVSCSSPTGPSGGESASRADPLWTATASQPSVARADAPALVLPSGRVLVAGGNSALGPTGAVELFNPSTESWQAGPALPVPQSGHVLALWEGLAVCTGGTRADALNASVTSWSPLGAPLAARTGAAGATLPDGRLVVIGGAPAPTDTERLEADGGWTALAPSTAPHTGHTATLLGNGTVEVVGGTTPVAETLDPLAGTWTLTAGPAVQGDTASLLPDGELLVVGAAAQRFNPSTGASVPVGGLRVPRASHSAVALPGGDVLVTGGQTPAAARSAERYIFSLDRFVASGCLDTPRGRHASVVLGDGGVVLVGGVGLDGGFLARSERLDFSVGLLAPGQPCALDCECGTGFCADGVCCDQACQGACLACSVAAGGAADGTCGLAGPSRICRGAVGLCDAPERCTGADAGCPADALLDAGAPCRAAVGTCDVAEQCTGVSPQCPVDQLADAGVLCRGAAGSCDVAEVCTGASGVCPADRFVDAGLVCRAAAAGGCDVAEACDGVSAPCPSDRFADAGVVCRAATGGCDLAESCTGASASCPADSVAFPGTECRVAQGPCDVAEVCTGTKTCPADGVRDAGVMCRAANGLCDAVDVCDGVLAACPDLFADAGVLCRAAIGDCDLDDVCDGLQAACPDAVAQPGQVCRPAAGGCDVAELCNGSAKACPGDSVFDAGVVCRAPEDLCDAPELCDGLTGACPADAVLDAGTVCRPAAGDCDVPELCDGKGRTCSEDLLQVTTHVCRPAAGVCDIAEFCNGLSVSCPADGFKEPGELCTAVGCTTASACTGTAADCPLTCEAPDAGMTGQHYVGWSCTCGETSGAPWLVLAVALLRRRRPVHPERRIREADPESNGARGESKPGRRILRGCGSTPPSDVWPRSTAPLRGSAQGARILVALFVSSSARAEPPVTSDFSVRANASILRDVLGSQVGAEVGANVSLTPRFDVAAAASLGSHVGGRFGVTWHLRDDGEWVRPFVQARALLHSAPDGVAAGGGAWAGIFVPLGPGRIQAGALFEAYGGPKSYVPYDAFVTLGYELDIFRRVERQGIKPTAVEAPPPAPVVLARPPPQPAPAEPVAAPAPSSAPAPAPAPEPTRVVTRINFSRDVITFDERRANWEPKADAVLRRVAETLKRYPNLKRVEVAGHADDGDDDAQCLKISWKRADAVVKALVAAGVEPARLVSKGYGNTRAKVSTRGPARKREQNRRVDFTVLE